MLRRLFNNLLETTLQNQSEFYFPHPFTKKETIPFGWLTTVAPCFPVNARNIRILTEPQEFYNFIEDSCKTAKERITLVSLYLGNGNLETNLIDAIKKNTHFIEGNLKVNVLLDFTRGSRLPINSRTTLQPLLKGHETNCTISLYHTPALRGFLKKFTPNRWNEVFGLQHMKLYIFDNTLVMSGANLSNDYFTNRQDRYFVINDRNLCDFYCGLVSNVQKFSLLMDENNEIHLNSDWKQLPYEGSQRVFARRAGDLIENYLVKSINDRNSYKENGFDTWIFPLIQMGQFGIEQESQIIDRLLSELKTDTILCIASGYFNLTNQYMDTLIMKCRANCKILMAHPCTNGFLNAKGPAGGIPYAYSLIAQQFQKKFVKFNQEHRIKLYEYLRDNWTYHAKGLWLYCKKTNLPFLTLIGSTNFGERSVKKDLETQLIIVTENLEFQQQLNKECSKLYKYGIEADVWRIVPKWVHGFVLFFRNYF